MPRFDKEANRVATTATIEVLPVLGGRLWQYAHAPNAWEVAEVDGVTRWLPVLRKLPFVKGANGVRHNGDTGQFETALTARGWTILRNNPNPKHILHYADAYPAVGGNVLVDRFTEIYKISPRKCRMRMEPDGRAEYDRWRAALVDQGYIEPPQEIVIEDIVDEYESRTVRRLMGKEQKPIIAEKLEAARAKLAVMRSAVITPPEGKARSKRNV